VVPVSSSVAATWFRRGRTNPWLVFLLPFVVYMLVGSLEPAAPAEGVKSASWLDLGIEYRHYPLVYSLKILMTAAAMAYVLPGYRQIPCRITPLAIGIGITGAAAWIALAIGQRDLQLRLGWSLGLDTRSAFNPLDATLISSRAWAYGFLAIRFIGLAIIVPVIEEFFLRGFVMRFVMAAEWWNVPIGNANWLAIIAGTVIPLLTHPFSEAVAVAVWFSAVTWLLLRTRNLWACVAAHATTNLLLGIYVLKTGDWWLM
jgi:CAAX prenyl protease-like protein